MARIVRKGPVFTIANNETESNVVSGHELSGARGMGIGAPAELDGTLTILVSHDDGVTWHTQQSGGSDIEIAVGKSVSLSEITWTRMKIKSSVAESPARTIPTTIVEER